MAARVGFEPATLSMQDTELTTPLYAILVFLSLPVFLYPYCVLCSWKSPTVFGFLLCVVYQSSAGRGREESRLVSSKQAADTTQETGPLPKDCTRSGSLHCALDLVTLNY